MKLATTGKSLLEIRQEYGIGESGFYDNTWWLNEPFAKEKPEAGVWDFDFKIKLTNLTYNEQCKQLKKGYKAMHPAVIAEAVLSYYKETGKRLLENWYSRTSSIDLDGNHVLVGYFDADGLNVGSRWDDFRYDSIGASPARKSKKNLDTRDLEHVESLPTELIVNGIKYKKV